MCNKKNINHDTIKEKVFFTLQTVTALPATEISRVTKVCLKKIKPLLAQLVNNEILSIEIYGGHKYYLLNKEKHTNIEKRDDREFVKTFTKNSDFARTCYWHLAGKVGVLFYNHLIELDLITIDTPLCIITEKGTKEFQKIGLILNSNCLGKLCLDRSERSYHLAGALGKAITNYFFCNNWISRQPGCRTVTITEKGSKMFKKYFEIDLINNNFVHKETPALT